VVEAPSDPQYRLAFAGIRRSILSLARKAELLPNRRQILISLAQVPCRPHPRIPSRGRTKPRAAARTEPRYQTEPRPTRRSLARPRDFQRIPKEISRSEKQKSIAIGKSNISLADCLGGDGNGRRFLLPNRSKPILSAFLNCLGCSLKKTLLTPKTAAKLISVVLSDSLLTQIQNCFVMSHG
jgi:hypothetical protein